MLNRLAKTVIVTNDKHIDDSLRQDHSKTDCIQDIHCRNKILHVTECQRVSKYLHYNRPTWPFCVILYMLQYNSTVGFMGGGREVAKDNWELANEKLRFYPQY